MTARAIHQPTELPDYIPDEKSGDKRWLVSTRLNGTKYLTMREIKQRMKSLQAELDDLESEFNRLEMTYNVPTRGSRR